VEELKALFPTGLIISPSHEAILPDVHPAKAVDGVTSGILSRWVSDNSNNEHWRQALGETPKLSFACKGFIRTQVFRRTKNLVNLV
jgi:hypothetical protein